jgi:BlaI family penicillinase repressor
MRVLWRQGAATARTITDALAEDSAIAHSTVQTLLRQLEAKRAVSHEQRDRTFYYQAIVTEPEVTRSATQDLLDRVFRGSITGLVAHLLESEEISDEEMARLRALVNSATPASEEAQ